MGACVLSPSGGSWRRQSALESGSGNRRLWIRSTATLVGLCGNAEVLIDGPLRNSNSSRAQLVVVGSGLQRSGMECRSVVWLRLALWVNLRSAPNLPGSGRPPSFRELGLAHAIHHRL